MTGGAGSTPSTTTPGGTTGGTTPGGSTGGSTTTPPPPVPTPMQTYSLRFLPSPSPSILGYRLSIATLSGDHDGMGEVNIPVNAAQAEGGGVFAYSVQMPADVDHFLAMRAYSTEGFSPYSNEIVVAAPMQAAVSTLLAAMQSPSAPSSASAAGTTAQMSSAARSSSDPASASESAEGDATSSTSAAPLTAIELDGAGEYLASSSAYALGATNAFTLSIWALSDPRASGSRALMSVRGGGAATQNRVELLANANDVEMVVYNASGQLVFQATYAAALVAGEWRHVAVTFDAQVDPTPVLFVDGALQTPANANLTGNPPTFSDSAGRLFVGGGGSDSTGTWWGAIGHAAIWSEALADDEVDEIVARGHALDLRENLGAYQAKDALLHYWRPGESTSAVGFDFGRTSVPIDLDDAAGNVDATDIVADGPTPVP